MLLMTLDSQINLFQKKIENLFPILLEIILLNGEIFLHKNVG